MPLLLAIPPCRLPRRPWATGPLARGLPLALAVWLAAIPLLGAGPTWAKACYARVARATQRGKRFEYTQLDGTPLLIGAVPRSAAHLQTLHDEGVRAVVTLNQAWEPQAPSATFADVGLAQLRLPTPDYAAPRQQDIRRAVAFIRQHAQSGHRVYVHCNGGKGRSAVCTLAYLVSQARLGVGLQPCDMGLHAHHIGLQRPSRGPPSTAGFEHCRGIRCVSGAVMHYVMHYAMHYVMHYAIHYAGLQLHRGVRSGGVAAADHATSLAAVGSAAAAVTAAR